MTFQAGDIVRYKYAKDLVRCVVTGALDWQSRERFYHIEICDKSWSGIAPAYRLHPENEPAPPGAQLTIFT